MDYSRTCTVSHRGGRYCHTTMGRSAYEVAANAIEWWEVDCASVGTAHRIGDDELMRVQVVAGRSYLVRAGRVRVSSQRKDED